MSLQKVNPPLSQAVPPRWQAKEHDEIDLRDLVIVLWRQKILILLVTGLFAIAGITYAMLAKQVWSAQAVIQPPEKQDILPMLRTASHAKLAGITEFPDNKSLYSEFIREFNAYENQRDFLKSSVVFMNHASANTLDDKGQIRRLHDWAKGISTQAVDKTGERPGITLSVSADTASDALNMLEAYIKFITIKQQQRLKRNLLAEKSLMLETQMTILKQTKDDAERALKNEIEQATLAVAVAKAANIERPLENYAAGDRFPITLGYKGLEENLKVLKTLDLNIYQPQLMALQVQIDRLKQVNFDSISFRPFSYLSAPEEPLSRDAPKRPLIVVLATLLGGMLGVGIVLVRHAFRKPEQK